MAPIITATMKPRPQHREEEILIRDRLIRLVRPHQIVWRKAHPDTLKGTRTRSEWAEIARRLRADLPADLLERHDLVKVAKVKDLWQQLRGTYRKNRKKIARLGDDLEVRWPHYAAMRFLEVNYTGEAVENADETVSMEVYLQSS